MQRPRFLLYLILAILRRIRFFYFWTKLFFFCLLRGNFLWLVLYHWDLFEGVRSVLTRRLLTDKNSRMTMRQNGCMPNGPLFLGPCQNSRGANRQSQGTPPAPRPASAVTTPGTPLPQTPIRDNHLCTER